MDSVPSSYPVSSAPAATVEVGMQASGHHAVGQGEERLPMGSGVAPRQLEMGLGSREGESHQHSVLIAIREDPLRSWFGDVVV